ncbi:MAG: hypothetical protein ONB05_11075, partial [candidate division KSB1 bacterium]|nr:hypothetical protein [candidate division KSB1 bacterium]
MKKYWLVVGLSLLVPGLVLGQWVFNNFEGDPFWGDQVDREENLETRAIISYVSDPAKFGQGALKIEWGATHNQSWGGGAYLNHVHPDSLGVFDFSEYDSLILWYYNESPSSLPGKVHLRFNLGDVSDSPTGYNTYSFGNMEYWYTFNYILDDPPGWRKLSFPLADVREDPQGKGFNRTGWYGIAGNDHLDLDAIKGFQLEFSISATQGDVAMGTIILDQMMLKKVDGDTMVLFRDFDRHPYWSGQVDIEEGLEHKAIVSYVSEPVKFGQAAMKIEWGATHDQSWGGGAYLNHLHPDSLEAYDFSEYDSLILWYYNESPSSLPGKVHLRFNLGDVSDSPTGYNTYSFGNMEYWYTFN